MRSASPVVQMVAGLVNGENPLGVMVIGTDAAHDEEAAAHRVSGRGLAGDDEALLVDNFAKSLKLSVDSKIRLLSQRVSASFASSDWSNPAASPASMADRSYSSRCPRPGGCSSSTIRPRRFRSCSRMMRTRTAYNKRSLACCLPD